MSEFNGSIVDVRTRAEFSGGHVANSVNIPFSNLLVDGQCFKSKEEIQK